MLSAWRIVRRHRGVTAFNGEGARLFGGRWNRKGTPMIYLSESRALAALELLVHLDRADLLSGYVSIEARLDDAWVERCSLDSLPQGWHQLPIPLGVQDIGEEWARSRRSVALCVPSAVVPGEFNYLLNPRHPGFGEVQIGAAARFCLDLRLGRIR